MSQAAAGLMMLALGIKCTWVKAWDPLVLWQLRIVRMVWRDHLILIGKCRLVDGPFPMKVPCFWAKSLISFSPVSPLLSSVCRCWKQYSCFHIILRMTALPWKWPGKWSIQLIILLQALKKNWHQKRSSGRSGNISQSKMYITWTNGIKLRQDKHSNFLSVAISFKSTRLSECQGPFKPRHSKVKSSFPILAVSSFFFTALQAWKI